MGTRVQKHIYRKGRKLGKVTYANSGWRISGNYKCRKRLLPARIYLWRTTYICNKMRDGGRVSHFVTTSPSPHQHS